MNRLDHFLLFGWARAHANVSPGSLGCERDPQRAALILAQYGVDVAALGLTVAEIGGVSWR